VWRVLEPLVDPRTRDKVTIVPEKDEAAIMASMFSPDQVLIFSLHYYPSEKNCSQN
jgi:hypothetical protein